ncbi:MAG: transcriptional regulator [Anaerolineaceae bacterium]|nr:transcriptional regulator [Anaerolineaceae bacterium]
MNIKKLDLDSQKKQANYFKYFTHPVRIAILQILGKGEACVCHMEAVLGLRQAYLSQQLAVLREGGLITDRKDGWNVFYQLTDPQILNVLHAVHSLISDDLETETSLVPESCSCPKCAVVLEKNNCC